MKKLFLLLLVPLLMATQCEDDEDVIVTDFFIQNNTGSDLVYISSENNQFTIESQSNQFIATGTISDRTQLPSESPAFDVIRLFRSSPNNNNLILVYEQNPIQDELWSLNEISSLNFEYTIIVTDTDLIE